MNETSKWIGRSLVACACAWAIAGPGLAPAQTPMLQQQMQGDVAYLSGGVGDDEIAFIKQSMKDYTMALVFSRAGSPRAEYVASVAVTIKDAKGNTVFEAPSAGPYLLVKLPAGRYAVVASYQNVTQTRPVAAAKAASPVTFVWK